ncbi:hypothetical protein VAE122_2890137 [Vibrio aestuarianus]|nr:hypothetical protein VAE122_2890137 [Vibrio aestuarianus]
MLSKSLLNTKKVAVAAFFVAELFDIYSERQTNKKADDFSSAFLFLSHKRWIKS